MEKETKKDSMRCPRCLNEDPSYFYKGSKGYYCRKCVTFSRILIEEDIGLKEVSIPKEKSEEYFLEYPLTKEQIRISKECAEYIDTSDVLIDAVTGAGKTELVVYSIHKMLLQKKKVCFAIARRQVVLELKERLEKIFKNAKVIAVCAGHTKELDGDLIVCTTHQLYRYYKTFDLLILDEPDAFPFYGNATLHGIASTSCKGHKIYLTATPDEELVQLQKEKKIITLYLYKRPHGYPVIVPEVKISFFLSRILSLLFWLKENRNTPRMVFVPTIDMAQKMTRFLSVFEETICCTSLTENRDEKIEEFRKKKDGICVSTTVLERGVTIPNVNVCVYEADHSVFSKASLIQMAGRAGRNFKHPQGKVLFLAKKKTQKVEDCVREIERANAI